MQARPFYNAAGISTTVQTIFILLSSLVAYWLVPSNLRVLDNLSPGFFGLISVTSCASAVLAPLAHAGTGILYAYLHRREALLTAEDGAIGGAASAATSRLIAGFTGTVVGFLFIPTLFSRLSANGMPQFSPNDLPVFMFPLLFSAAGSVIGLCFGALIAGAIGALGGALASLFVNKQVQT
jgi:hypothetical protein